MHCGLILAVVFLIITSCVKQEYNIGELNTEMTIGAAGLVIPLGSTQQLRIQDFLDSTDVDLLSKDESGVFSISLKDSLSLTDNIPNLSQMVKINGINFSSPYNFSMEGLNQDISVDAKLIEHSFSFGDAGIMSEMDLAPMLVTNEVYTGVSDLLPNEEQLSLKLEDMDYSKDNIFQKTSLEAISITGDEEVVIPDGVLPKQSLEKKTYQMEISVALPEGIKSVSEVTLDPNAKVKCSLSIIDPFITKGDIVPAIDVDLSSLLEIAGTNDPIHLSELVLNEENGYTASKTYDVTAFNILPSEWEGKALNVTKDVTISGDVSVSGVATTKSAIEGSENMKLLLYVTYIDMKFDNIEVEVDPIEKSEEVVVPIEIEEISLPEEVASVGKITIAPESVVTYTIKPDNLIDGLNLNMKSLKFIFPESMEVEGADAEGILSVAENVDLSTEYKGSINIKSITPANPVGGKFSYKDQIKVLVECTADGVVGTKNLPTDPSKYMVIKTELKAELMVEDCEINTNKVTKSLDVEPEEFVIEFPGEVADFGTFVVVPEGEQKIEIDIDIPETGIEIEVAGEGLVIELPEMLVLKDVNPAYNYDAEEHTLTLKGTLPPQIILPIKELVVKPEKGNDGKYVSKGTLAISGAIEIPAGKVAGSELEELITTGISLNINIPAIKADQISVTELSFGVSQEESFTLFKAEDLPREVKEISNIEIEQTKLKVALVADNLPDFGEESDINIDVLVNLPDMIVPNQIHLQGVIEDGKFNKEFTIEDLDLSGVDFSSQEDITGEIVISGGIYVSNPTIDMDKLSAEEVGLNLSASIPDIKVSKLEGKVDYPVDNTREAVALTDLPDFLRSDDVCLDIDNPRIEMEITTNIGVPITGVLNMVPYKNGLELENSSVEFALDLPYTKTSEETITTTFWVAGKNSGVPADVKFVEANLANIIKAVPDSIIISLAGGTDPTKTSIIETTADYTLDLNYNFVVPLSFGEDMKFAMSDTMDVSDAGIGGVLKMGEIQLVGWIHNSLPLNFDLSIDLLDSNDQIMETEPVTQTIKPCNSDGSASETPLKMGIAAKNGTDMTKLAKLKVSFVITSKNVSGIPITEDSYIQAKMGVNLPSGITLNFDEE